MEEYEFKERARADYKGIHAKPGLYYNGEWIEPPWGKPIEEKPGFISMVFGSTIETEMAKVFEGRQEAREEVDIDIPTPKTDYYPSTRRFGKMGAVLPIVLMMVQNFFFSFFLSERLTMCLN